MRVFVTGASGAVGSAVVERFAAGGNSVRALVRTGGVSQSASETVIGDVGDRDAVNWAARDVELCVHCAASTSSDLPECQRVNVEGTRNLVNALLSSGATLVHISTISVYDDAAGPAFDEDSPLWTSPVDGAYGFTKAEAERVVAEGVARGLRAVILRPSMVLSMHRRSRWGPLAIERARHSTACLVPFPELPHTHVDNLVVAIQLAAASLRASGRAYNVVDSVGDTREYLDVVYSATGRPTPPIPPGAPQLRFAANRIRRELRWAPNDRWRDFLDELRAVSGGDQKI